MSYKVQNSLPYTTHTQYPRNSHRTCKTFTNCTTIWHLPFVITHCGLTEPGWEETRDTDKTNRASTTKHHCPPHPPPSPPPPPTPPPPPNKSISHSSAPSIPSLPSLPSHQNAEHKSNHTWPQLNIYTQLNSSNISSTKCSLLFTLLCASIFHKTKTDATCHVHPSKLTHRSTNPNQN